MELPVEYFNVPEIFTDRGPGGKRDALVQKMFAANGKDTRQPVVLRILKNGSTIEDLARAASGARARSANAVPAHISAYIIHNPEVNTYLDQADMAKQLGGRFVMEGDKVLAEATTTLSSGGSRRDPNHPSRFTRFLPFRAAEFLSPTWAQQPNPAAGRLEDAVAAHAHPHDRLTFSLPASVPLDHVPAARQILVGMTEKSPPLYRYFPVQPAAAPEPGKKSCGGDFAGVAGAVPK
jgi:hypothetical protein